MTDDDARAGSTPDQPQSGIPSAEQDPGPPGPRPPADSPSMFLQELLFDDETLAAAGLREDSPILGYLRQMTYTELATHLDDTTLDPFVPLIYQSVVIDEMLRKRPSEATERNWQRILAGLNATPADAFPPPAPGPTPRPPRGNTPGPGRYQPRDPR